MLFKLDVCLIVRAKEEESFKNIEYAREACTRNVDNKVLSCGPTLKSNPLVYTCTLNKRVSVSGKYLGRNLWHFKDGH